MTGPLERTRNQLMLCQRRCVKMTGGDNDPQLTKKLLRAIQQIDAAIVTLGNAYRPNRGL